MDFHMITNRIVSLLILFVSMAMVIPPAMAQPKPKQSFEEWLENYGAWDKLEKEFAKDEESNDPASILKRAEVYLYLNSPEEALELIEMTPTFADNATEAERLWMGGQAHRAIGDLTKSVLWFTKAASYFTEREARKRLRKEPDLEPIWKDVWLKLYWAYTANYTISRGSQKELLNNIIDLGDNAWGDKYWEKAQATLNPELGLQKSRQTKRNREKLGPDGLPLSPPVSSDDTNRIVQGLAALSLGKFDEAKQAVEEIQKETIRYFWISTLNLIQDGTPIGDLTPFASENYLKAHSFWQGDLLGPYTQSNNHWLLGNQESGPWKKFRNNLLEMPLENAKEAIDNELGSMLISEQTATLLKHFKLALLMANGDFFNSSELWKTLKKQELTISLQLAGILFFNEDLKNILPLNPRDSYAISPILTALSGAAGHDINELNEAPFWISAPADQLESLSEDYPMDNLLLLAWWQKRFDEKPTVELAKRSAFLFDDSTLGIKALLYLAEKAVKENRLQLGAYYLNRIASDKLIPSQKMAWLNVKLQLELESGRSDAGMKTFLQMNKLEAATIPPMTRLRMALLFQQKRNFKAAREQLLTMWEQRDDLTTTLQAEILFWLGEGEQGMRNTEAALDYYLRLAWQYPQENIWALTAMYRASLIYEKRGKYETAKRLLGTVMRQADTKEQREAAKARLNAIDRKMGKAKSDQKSTLVYPF